ncbi:MAG: indolepyruvate oxidoreductase subunit beta [Hydrogenoanaerobacterium sp.]
MNDITSIMLVGVGGQGTLLASRILGNMLLSQGFDVKVSEVHGMSQRGGSVVTYVKYGKKVYSPIIERGEADYIIAFELCEAARWVSYLKKDGKMIINTQKISPMPVITGAAQYPEHIVEKLEELGCDVVTVDALALAEKAGSAKATNVVLMGAMSKIMDFDERLWEKTIAALVPAKLLDINMSAFAFGAGRKKTEYKTEE